MKRFFAGQQMTVKFFFGDYKRYAIAPIMTREGTPEWFVWDAETPDYKTGLASVIRQADSLEAAFTGLDDDWLSHAQQFFSDPRRPLHNH